MYKSFLTLTGLMALIFFAACDSDKMQVSESGLQYKFVKKGEGPKADSGLVLMLNVNYMTEDDSILFETEEGRPAPLNYPINEEGLFLEAVRMMSEGDSMILKIPAADFFLTTYKRPVPEGLTGTSYLTFNVGVERVLDRNGFNEYTVEMNERLQKEAAERAKVQVEIDKKLIKEYLDKNGIEAEQTESGLFYVMKEEGTGENAKAGDQVAVHYAGYVLDGAYFDASIEEVVQAQGLNRPGPYEPIKFRLGTGAVIQGWDEGISLLNQGAKATIYIPSTLAYGERKRSEVIVENSILVFDVELIEITTLEQ